MTLSRSENPRGRQAFDISIAFTVIACVIVGMRLYTRAFLVRCPGLEDYFIFLALLSTIGFAVCIGFQVHYSMGHHIVDIEPEDSTKSLKAFWVSLIFYGLALGFQKISILLQYLRVFTTPRFTIVSWVMIVFVSVYSTWTVFGNIFTCIPVRAFWTKEPNAKCLNQFAMWFTNAGINILQDFLIIIMPMPVIRSLNLGKRQKGALIGIFAVGGFVCVVSILRLPQLVSISNSTDPTYDNAGAATWSCVEANVGIICACLPLLRPLVTRLLPGFFSSHKRTDTAPRLYSTIGTSHGRRNLQSHSAYVLNSSARHPQSKNSDEDDRDIQVITDIRVQVEDDEGNLNGWRSDVSGKSWVEMRSAKAEPHRENSTHSSTDTLVKEPSSRSA
ncbi:hypothetical protein IAQ61_010916 [Plenodomus lingam]|uniref:Rhodopsin domain-containing protein n=1 Tax=Leptosphaeria maculans (strain JN3 / isolate v23.1.3 / race Av1-4-5-6-7-8) TaxID=985895 RepID=E4ZK17_LEPMJ|nr:hypothetical protein LEMA_P071200.1 [Plenodomus lingam JN3]KAH9861179.1 hypothetical protein IAQ61_010916 [Plenodomus lingam]CBX91612.1 hypothetical protein LEMA_P071200.1 [Plenodomus lingam JN3]